MKNVLLLYYRSKNISYRGAALYTKADSIISYMLGLDLTRF